VELPRIYPKDSNRRPGALCFGAYGAGRVPEIARALGASTREFRKGISQGAAEGEDRKHKDQEKPPLDEAD
jgi:Sec-independent protein translocase protein TatA